MTKLSSVLILLLLFCAVMCSPALAAYSNTFAPTDSVVVNQSLAQDPTRGNSIPWTLWIISGIAGLVLTVFSLTRTKTQVMDYEVNIIISGMAWPFFAYFMWGGMTSIDYVAGMGVAANSNMIAAVTQHVLYTPWVLGIVGIMGFFASVFVTTLLIAQYRLFKDKEAENMARQRGVQQ